MQKDGPPFDVNRKKSDINTKLEKRIVWFLVVNSRGRFLGLAVKLHLLARGDGGGDGRPHLTELPLEGGGGGRKQSDGSELQSCVVFRAEQKGVGFPLARARTSYLFWSSAAFLIHSIFSFFSMEFQVVSIAFWALGRSLCGGRRGHGVREAASRQNRPIPSLCPIASGR